MNKAANWLIPGLLGLQAAFTGSTFTTTSICLALFGMLAIAALLHRRWKEARIEPRSERRGLPRSMRWLGNAVMYALVIGLVGLWRFGDYAGASINPMAFAFDALTHAALVSAMLLWVMHPTTGHGGMLALGLLVVLLCVAAGGASHTLAGQLAVALATITGFSASSHYILGNRYRQSTGQQTRAVSHPHRVLIEGSTGAGRVGMLFSLLVLSAVLMTTTAIAHVTELMLPAIKSSVHDQLSNSLEALQDQSMIGSSRYVRGSRIGLIRRHMLSDPTSIALRAYAGPTPGYLRGTVFDAYADGRWAAMSNERLAIQDESDAIEPRELLSSGQGLTRLAGPSNRALRRFFLQTPDDARIASIEVHNDPHKGQVIFTPLATRWLEGNARSITVSHHDVIMDGVSVSSPYVCGVASTPVSKKLEQQRRELLLYVHRGLETELKELANSICQSRPTATAKASAIASYFSTQFAYSLTEDPPRLRGDPIRTFLNTKHAAHCEYFATATVLLLRSAGVPARYVTGYVADEYSEEEACWLARNRDAHAWAEAYDDVSETWFPVESTPGRVYESMALEDSSAAADGSDIDAGSGEDGGSDTILGRLWGWITSMRATDPLIVLFRLGQAPLFCVVVILLWMHFRRGYDSHLAPDDLKSIKMLQRIDRRLKRHSLVRPPHETLHQFADRIENELRQDAPHAPKQQAFLAGAAKWYRDYASARYRGQLPAPFVHAA